MAAETLTCVISSASSFQVAGFATPIMVITGWFIVHKATLSRERRREKRFISEKVCDELTQLETTAIDFHTAPHFDGRHSLDLARQIEKIIFRLNSLPIKELNIPGTRVIELRKSITSRNIDPSDFLPQPADSELILGIREAIADVANYIESRREHCWK